MRTPRILAGVFVGGASRRMGGSPKALLAAPEDPHETLLTRSIRVLRAAAIDDVVLVGEAPWLGDAMRDVPRLADRTHGAGPLAGLAALLDEGSRRGIERVIAMACDMPYVTAFLVERLVQMETTRPIVAPRSESDPPRWDPLFARYECARLTPVVRELLDARRLSMQAIFDRLGAEPMRIDSTERDLLRDWDAPHDVHRDRDE